MNVIIANNQKDKFVDLDIEIIKRLDGVFEVDEIISTFQNLFYNKMILDITALKNYDDINTFQKLSIGLDINKLILLLEPDTATTLPAFLSKLISVGIYNFTTTVEGLNYLYNNPNTYRDVAQYHNIVSVSEPVVAPTPIVSTTQTTNEKVVKTVTTAPVQVAPIQRVLKIIGLKSITHDAGATTLAIMMNKILSKSLDVLCIELDKNDFRYFKDRNLVSTSSANLGNIINQNANKDVIIVDINDSNIAPNICTEVLYLIEPSTIKLNKLVLLKPIVLKGLKGKKVVLNKSSLNEKDVKKFSYEANLDVFYNLPSLDERKANDEVALLLKKLNIM